MPLCFSSSSSSMSTDPHVRDLEKRIAQEARSDQRNLDHVVKDLKTAEKNHQKAIKVRDFFHLSEARHVELKKCLFFPGCGQYTTPG